MSKKSGNDSDSSEELKKIANLKISDDDKLNEMVVAIDEAPLYDDNDKLFRGKFKNMKIDPITHVKRGYSPVLPSPLSALSSGDNTPRSLASADSVGSLSGLSERAIAPTKKIKKESPVELCQECKPDSIFFHPGRAPKSNRKKDSKKKKGGKTKKRKNKRKKTRRRYKR